MWQKMLQVGSGGGENIAPKLLWKNPSPTSAMGATTLSVDSTGYDSLMFVCAYTTTTQKKQRTIINKSEYAQSSDWLNNISCGGMARKITNLTDTSITVSIGTTQAGVTNTLYLPIIAIYGIKQEVV